MALDRDMLNVQDLVNRIDELECAAAASLHVNQHLNKEIERCVQAAEAARAHSQAWKQRADWLAKQLVQAHKQLRTLTSGQGEFDEAHALAALLERAEQAAAPSLQHGHSTVQFTSSQEMLLRKLVASGQSAGWLIDHAEVQMGPLLGEGEFGVTYMGTWRGSKVAIKCVRAKSPSELGNFLREVEALCGLRHPHVLPFLGACMTRGTEQLWLVTEHMEQGTLAAWMYPHKYSSQVASMDQGSTSRPEGAQPGSNPPLPPSSRDAMPGAQAAGGSGVVRRAKPFLERVRMAYEVAQGLQALEAMHPPLLHRDIKPSNIFVDGGGHARVGDFGLARRLLPEAVANLTGETGSYLYMAPEVMRHEVYDSKADVWSWGVLLVELLTLQLPYQWTYMLPEQIALGVAEEQLAPLVPDNVDIDLQAIARLALNFSAEERPPFSLITQELGSAYDRLTRKQALRQQGGPGLLASVSKQLSSTWTGLLQRLYSSHAMTPAASSNQAAGAVAQQS